MRKSLIDRVVLPRFQSLYPLELLQRGFPDIDGIGCHSDNLLWFEPGKHRKKVDVSIGEHRGSQVSVLGLGAVVIREDLSQRASRWGSNQSAALTGVSHEEVEFSLVDHQPSGQSSAVGFCIFGELANDAASLISIFREPHIGLLLKGDDGFPNLQGFQETGFCEVGQELRRGPTAASEMLPEPGMNEGMTCCIKLPFLDLGEACAYVFWKRAIDCYAGHS